VNELHIGTCFYNGSATQTRLRFLCHPKKTKQKKCAPKRISIFLSSLNCSKRQNVSAAELASNCSQFSMTHKFDKTPKKRIMDC